MNVVVGTLRKVDPDLRKLRSSERGRAFDTGCARLLPPYAPQFRACASDNREQKRGESNSQGWLASTGFEPAAIANWLALP